MKLALALLALPTVFGQSPDDPKEITRKSVERDFRNFESLKNYTYTEREDERTYNRFNKLIRHQVDTFDILILGGRPYARLTERDGRPLPPREAAKEQQKMDQELAKRQHESSGDKANEEKRRQENRKFLQELPEAMTFQLAGEDTVSGQPAWVIAAEPRPGYQPKEARADVLTKMRGKIWIDTATFQWVKIDAEAIDKMSFALRLLQIEPGSNLQFEQTRVNDEVWLPSSITIRASARVAYVRKLRTEVDITYSNYRKFQAESHLVPDAGDR